MLEPSFGCCFELESLELKMNLVLFAPFLGTYLGTSLAALGSIIHHIHPLN